MSEERTKLNQVTGGLVEWLTDQKQLSFTDFLSAESGSANEKRHLARSEAMREVLAFTASPCSDYECGDKVTIEGHGKRTVNAQIGEYLFLDTDTDGPFIDTVHVSFVQNTEDVDASR